MSCEMLEKCQFFQTNMKDLPKAAQFIKNRFCFGDFERCNRYIIYKKSGCESVPLDLYPGCTAATEEEE